MTLIEEPTCVDDASAQDTATLDREPFRVKKEDKRRFVRLEISSPMSLQKIKDSAGGFWPDGDWHVINGSILNISAGGVLVDLNQEVNSGDIVSMHFTMQKVEEISNVLGLVKRVDGDDGSFITGIQFISAGYLLDHFSRGEVDLLADQHTNFSESVQNILNKYLDQRTEVETDR